MSELPYGEDVNYWQTGSSSPDTWMEKTKKLILDLGGQVLMEGFGSEPTIGRSAFMLAFEIEGDNFKVIWPVLPSKTGKELAARRQAATMLYHDTKAKCLSAVIVGARAAFFSYLLLPDGRTAVEASIPELQTDIPSLFSTPQLDSGTDVVEGEYLIDS